MENHDVFFLEFHKAGFIGLWGSCLWMMVLLVLLLNYVVTLQQTNKDTIKMRQVDSAKPIQKNAK